MKPTCKLCETKHWTWDEHTITSALDKTRALGADVLAKMGVHQGPPTQLGGLPIKRTEETLNGQNRPEKNKRTEPLRNKRTRGRPKKWASEAERKRAYRERR